MLKINKDSKPSREFDYNIEYFPKPGMLGTMRSGSDRYSVICLSNDTPTRITICTLWGLDENNIKDNPDILIDENGVMWMNLDKYKKYHPSTPEHWSKRKNRGWREMNKTFSSPITWGIATPYSDPDF